MTDLGTIGNAAFPLTIRLEKPFTACTIRRAGDDQAYSVPVEGGKIFLTDRDTVRHGFLMINLYDDEGACELYTGYLRPTIRSYMLEMLHRDR